MNFSALGVGTFTMNMTKPRLNYIFLPNRVMSSPDGVKDDTHYFKTDEIKTNLFSSG